MGKGHAPIFAVAVGIHEQEVLHFPRDTVTGGRALFLDEPIQNAAERGKGQALRLELDVEHRPRLVGRERAHLFDVAHAGMEFVRQVEFVRRVVECQRIEVVKLVVLDWPIEFVGQEGNKAREINDA
ncbi:MAG: hypothetical protein HUU46_05825 [Candidatus Hydrogenedentes bacterium]|nr:hypothetical protein [Candidatus Hydrogenedentota bacterium]